MPDIFSLLEPFRWRGVEYPVMERNVSFLHENVDHRIQYRANDFPEPIGPHSFLFKYTVPMRQDIIVGPFEDLFNVGLPILVRDMRNKEPGDLSDPVYGSYRCIPVSFSETTDINKRDGTDVQIEFLHAPRIGDSDPELPPTVTGIVGLMSDRKLMDDDIKLQNWNQKPSPEGTTSAINAITGIIKQGKRQVDRLGSGLSALGLQLQKLTDAVDDAENPQNWRIRQDARDLQLDILDLNKRLSEDPGTKIKKLAVKTTMTVSSMAARLGMTVKELLDLNPKLARSPRILAGTILNTKQKNKTKT